MQAPLLSHVNSSAVGINLGITRQPEIIVRPALPPPNTDRFLYLSNLDDKALVRTHIPVIQFYRYNPSKKTEDPVKTIREALRKTLVHYYPLAGRLRDADNGKLQLECTGEGVLFVEADAHHVSLKDFGDLICPPIPCLDDLLYQPSGSETITDSPLLIIQVTRLRCGGFILALRSNHCICDAIGLLQFMKALAEIARGALLPSITPVWDREILRPRTNRTVKYAHQAFDRTDDEYTQQEQQGHHVGNLEEEMQNLSVLFGSDEIAALKRQVGGGYCSTFEVLSACLWRARSKALNIPAEQEARFTFPINIRSRLQPSFPTGYYGNALSASHAVARTGDLTERPLSFAVKLINDAKRIVDDGFIRSEIDMMEVMKGRPPPTMDRRSFTISDNTKVDFTGLDFGWGESEYGGAAVGAVPGISCLIPVRSTSSGIERIAVPICLPTTAIQTFQQELSHTIY